MRKLIVLFTALMLSVPVLTFAQQDKTMKAKTINTGSGDQTVTPGGGDQTLNPSEINGPKVTWIKDFHDFGEIPQNKPVTVEFTLRNDGNSPLLITNVRPTCGCTTAGYTKEPIRKGETGYIKATFNAKSLNTFTKSVTITTNAGTHTLKFKGVVVAN